MTDPVHKAPVSFYTCGVDHASMTELPDAPAPPTDTSPVHVPLTTREAVQNPVP